MPTGRPSKFTKALAERICKRLADGESLRQVCRDPAMPAMATVMRWVRKHDGFREQYVVARELLIEHHAEEIIDIADDGSNDWMQREIKGGRIVTVLNDEHVRRSEVRISARKWLLSKLAPKRYGDRVDLNVSGELTHREQEPIPVEQRESDPLASAAGSAARSH